MQNPEKEVIKHFHIHVSTLSSNSSNRQTLATAFHHGSNYMLSLAHLRSTFQHQQKCSTLTDNGCSHFQTLYSYFLFNNI